MFKKVEIWILYLVMLLGIPFTLIFGVLVRQEIEGITKFGKIDISFISKPSAFISRLPEELVLMLLKPNPLQVNSFWNNREFFEQYSFEGTPNTNESYLLLARYDGDLKEGIVELIDLTNFQNLHTWNPDIDKFNNLVNKEGEFKYINRDKNNSRVIPEHPLLTSNGELVFKNSGPLRKIDHCSNLIYQNNHDVFHHSIEIDIDGNFWVPSHMYPQALDIKKVGKQIKEDGGYLDDAIVKLSSDGRILFEKSVSEIFIDNNLEYLLFSSGDAKFDKDPIHLNDIQPVNYDGDYWKKGDVFLSLRHQSMVLLYRPSSNKIIWKGTGPLFHQHDVDILDQNRISIFNNNSKYFFNGDIVDGHNEVNIYNFKTKEFTSYLKQSLIKNEVRTITGGRSEILPNGDLFIVESNSARTLYFNSDGTLKWNHVNRANNGNVYKVGWSRILYSRDDILNVRNFLESRGKCYAL